MPGLDPIDVATTGGDRFLPFVGTAFRASQGGEGTTLTLLEVTEYPDHTPDGGPGSRKPFGLVFQCAAAMLPQGIYALEHPELGPCEIFLSPFEGSENGCKLEAIFN